MGKKQLFRKIPPRDICLKLLNSFGLQDFNDNHHFTRSDLVALGTVEKLENMTPILREYYLPCKARSYLNDLNTKNIITILRQLVRVYGFSILSREKYMKGDKFMIYQLVNYDCKKYKPIKKTVIKKDGTNYVVKFD